MPASNEIERPSITDEIQKSGLLVRKMREGRHMSQRMLADRSGVHSSTISRLERGLADTTVAVLRRLAYAMRCAPEDLMIRFGRPLSPLASPTLHADLQRSLIGTSVDDPLRDPGQPVTVAERIQRVRELRVAGRYRLAAGTAAECMADGHLAVSQANNRRQARERLTHLCFDAAICARILGDTGTAWIASDRCRQLAHLTRRPVAMAAAGFAKAYVALARTVPTRSIQLAEATISRTDPTTPDAAAMNGMLHLIAALAAVRAHGRSAAAERHLLRAQQLLGAADGNTDPFALYFDQETVAQWQVNIALELGDTATAAATFAQIDVSRISQPNRQAVYFLDLARIYAALGRTRAAADMLQRAELLSREYVWNSSAAHRLRESLGEPVPARPL